MTNAAEPRCAASGRVAVRVRYPETDRMQVAYHAHYLVWFEIGRTELMRELGCAYAELEERDGIAFPLTEAGVRYHASARYDDLLDVDTRLVAIGGARVRFEYRLFRSADGTLLASGFTEHAATRRDGKPQRMPARLRQRLEAGCRT